MDRISLIDTGNGWLSIDMKEVVGISYDSADNPRLKDRLTIYYKRYSTFIENVDENTANTVRNRWEAYVTQPR